HPAHGLDRQGHGGSRARKHGGRRNAQTYRSARQICPSRREGAGVRGPADHAPRCRELYGRPAARTAGCAGAATGGEPVQALRSRRLLALACGGIAALCAGRGRHVFQSWLRSSRRPARAGGKPYATPPHERVTAPLDMLDTAPNLSDAQRPRAMTGIDLDGKEAPLWDTPAAMDASGNVFTTADDMTKWMRWHLAVNDA